MASALTSISLALEVMVGKGKIEISKKIKIKICWRRRRWGGRMLSSFFFILAAPSRMLLSVTRAEECVNATAERNPTVRSARLAASNVGLREREMTEADATLS